MSLCIRKLLAQFVLVVMVVGSVVGGYGVPGSANTGGYPYHNAPTCSSGNCEIDPWRFFKRECTSFVAWKLNTANGLAFQNDYDGNGALDFGNAQNWKLAAESFGIRVDNVPAVGAVAWWSFGHVAWVKSVNADGTVTIEEYNTPAGSGNYHSRDVPTSSVSGFIHFKDLPSNSPPPPTPSTPSPTFNQDSRADLAWFHAPRLHMLAGQSDGRFAVVGSNPASSPLGTPEWAGAGDVTGNGRAEAIWYHTGTIHTLRWSGSTWQIVGRTNGIGKPTVAVAGDFNGNGRADLAWFNAPKLHLLTGQTDGRFSLGGSNPDSSPIGTASWAGAGNVDGIGRDEVVWYQNGTIYTFQWSTSLKRWTVLGQTGGIGEAGMAVVGG